MITRLPAFSFSECEIVAQPAGIENWLAPILYVQTRLNLRKKSQPKDRAFHSLKQRTQLAANERYLPGAQFALIGRDLP